ncbi:MAG TPA: HAD-IIA family hydrolase [Propionibacteriaceae bacterium]|nr:HAD-IIA family hydrolase [Propionibacteriaceae bacterium]
MNAAAAVVDSYDAVLFDLDGVIYLGPVAVPGAAAGIAQLHDRGTKIGFVTNNAARPPTAVADHLVELGIPAAAADVITSAQAAAHLLVKRFGPGARILAVGGDGVTAALGEARLVAVRSADDDPVAVIQGYGVDLRWQELNEAAIAIQRGAHWVATNVDSTRPTDRGLVPGNGAAVTAVKMAVQVEPEVAGKPYRPLLDDTVERLAAHHPLFVGDRLDTDIAAAVNAGLDSMLVLSGSHRAEELLAAAPGERPTHVGEDLRALLRPPLIVTQTNGEFRCGRATASTVDGRLMVHRNGSARIEAIWAAAYATWWAVDHGLAFDWRDALGELQEPLR